MSERDPQSPPPQRDHTAEILRRYNAGAANAGAVPAPSGTRSDWGVGRPAGRESLVDVLDRVLDKGVVIAGDISISLLDIELLTIKLRLLIASVDKAREMGIDWWNHDPQLSSAAKRQQQKLDADRDGRENRQLRERVEELESQIQALLEDRRNEPEARQGRDLRDGRREERRDRAGRGG